MNMDTLSDNIDDIRTGDDSNYDVQESGKSRDIAGSDARVVS